MEFKHLKSTNMKKLSLMASILFVAILSAIAQEGVKKEPLIIESQGSFAVGEVLQNPGHSIR